MQTYKASPFVPPEGGASVMAAKAQPDLPQAALASVQKSWDGKPYHSLDYEMRRRFGGKVWKLSLQSGCSCPNRDGTLGYGGCIFCSEGGSGDFAAPAALPIREQLAFARSRVEKKLPASGFAGYMAYFQSFTNTYGAPERLFPLFQEALCAPDVLALSIATRPDCLPDEIVSMLSALNREKPVYIELGLQTIHEKSAAFIRRGYPLPVFEDAVMRLKQAGLSVVTHLIVGLPNETAEDIEESVRYLSALRLSDGRPAVDGVKLQLLHILRGTELGRRYLARDIQKKEAAQSSESLQQNACAQAKPLLQGGGDLPEMPVFWNDYTLSEYADLIVSLIELLPPEMTVHRLTGDAPKRLLLAPLWSADKKRVLNTLSRRFSERNSWQGKRVERLSCQP